MHNYDAVHWHCMVSYHAVTSVSNAQRSTMALHILSLRGRVLFVALTAPCCVRCSAGAPGVVNTAAQGGKMQEPKVGKCKSDCSVGCSTILLHRAVTPPQGRLRISTLAKNWPFTPTLMLLGCTKPCTARPAEAAARCFLVKAASPVHHLVAVWARARSSTGGPDGRHDCP